MVKWTIQLEGEQEVSLYFRLNKDINPQELLKKLQDEINNHRQSNSLEDSILCIEIKNTSHVVENLVRQKVSAYLEGSQ
jgi:hypothetical protein